MKTTKKQSDVTIGIDLGDRRHAVCVLDAADKIITEEAITNTRECLTAFAQRFPAATIAMETGTHSPWISRVFTALGLRVIVANARKLRAISQSQTKRVTNRTHTSRPPFDNHDHRRIFMDIQAHVFICRLHGLVSVSGCFGCCSHFTLSLAVLPLTR